ncbi:MAG: peroxide stress protein YaaA [Bacteroidota bacterium]
MIVLISPAKSLDFSDSIVKSYSQPRMLEQSESLVKTLKKKSAKNLKELMKVSDNIAQLNVERYRNFQTPFTPENAKQAVLAFNGDVYTGLEADGFSEEDMVFAQQHLRILSGLYGVLKPLDLIQPYRLEMGTRLKQGRKKNLYEFWDDRITNTINEDLEQSPSNIVLNLASKEYFHSVKPNVLNGELYHVEFKELRDDKYKVISFNAKRARGMMANKIIKKQITTIAPLKRLSIDGYRYKASMSEKHKLLFVKE